MEIVISDHAKFEMARRQISEELVQDVARNPQQVLKLREGRIVWQSRYYDSTEHKEMLLRIVCEERQDMFFIITVYRTSKVDKYWRKEG